MIRFENQTAPLARSDNTTSIAQRYQRAEQQLTWHLTSALNNLTLKSHWINSQCFWFQRELTDGNENVLVDTIALKESLIDTRSEVKSVNKNEDMSAVLSLNGKWEVFRREDNLIIRECSTGQEKPLTLDGEPHYGYGTYADFVTLDLYLGEPVPPAALWSLDSRYLAVQRIDERQVQDMPLMQTVPLNGSLRPLSDHYKMAFPGDEHVPLATLCVIELATGRIIQINREPSYSGFVEMDAVQWGDDHCLYFIERTRDRKTLRFVCFDPVDGTSRVLIEEQGQGHLYLNPFPFGSPIIKVLVDSNEFIWYSQCSDWGHLYRYDLTTGELKNAITAGSYVVTKILFFDPVNQRVYFSACGRESNCNPYYEQVYRVNLDGSDLVLLTPEASQHDVYPLTSSVPIIETDSTIHGFSPDGRIFIDTISRIDQPAKSVLRSSDDGRVLMNLSYCDEALLAETPYTPPRSFTAKAADGETDLWGVMYCPSDFDQTHCYPVILCIYGTPHECITPKRFGQTSSSVRDIYRTLAELGFIVVIVDPRGTPLRSKSFHDVAYGNLQNGGGIDDQVTVLKQLGEQYAWVDLDRVGIAGHSGGGFAATHAMLTYPDFFKVAVASAGNHDQRLYDYGWGETFQGLVEGDNYVEQACRSLAQNLKGKLLLAHGDMDPNVHIAHTLQLVDALIEHNKDFDLLILPNRGHSFNQDTYFIRRVWDYFVEHLLKETPPKNYRITPPNLEEDIEHV